MNERQPTADLAREMIFRTAVERIDVAVDWVELFKDFCQKHGNEPVFWQGRLLFEDGWTHSADSHRGPSWSPPTEPLELRRLKTEYWMERRRLVRAELDRLEEMVEQLSRLSMVRGGNVPIISRSVADGRFNIERATFDPATFQAERIGLLQADVDKCDARLKELRDEPLTKESTNERPQTATPERQAAGAGGGSPGEDRKDHPAGPGQTEAPAR
jgi:hypothetical protein